LTKVERKGKSAAKIGSIDSICMCLAVLAWHRITTRISEFQSQARAITEKQGSAANPSMSDIENAL
jgi:hypothetical protein